MYISMELEIFWIGSWAWWKLCQSAGLGSWIRRIFNLIIFERSWYCEFRGCSEGGIDERSVIMDYYLLFLIENWKKQTENIFKQETDYLEEWIKEMQPCFIQFDPVAWWQPGETDRFDASTPWICTGLESRSNTSGLQMQCANSNPNLRKSRSLCLYFCLYLQVAPPLPGPSSPAVPFSSLTLSSLEDNVINLQSIIFNHDVIYHIWYEYMY